MDASTPTTRLAGIVDRITFASEETGYTVVRLVVKGKKEPVTVVGNFPALHPGEVLILDGTWSFHPKYGEQFQAVAHETAAPATQEGIRNYLSSGFIHGIGPEMARRIVDKFGADTLFVIENHPEKLTRVEGIGPKRVEMIGRAWAEQSKIRSLMIFLQSHGVSAAFAVRVYKAYGDEALETITQNPYRMAEDIYGVGFVTADQVAAKLGMEKNSPLRLGAGLLYTLQRLADEGHVCCGRRQLLDEAAKILEVPVSALEPVLLDKAAEKKIVMDASTGSEPVVYLFGLFLCESRIAQYLERLMTSAKSIRQVDVKKALEWVQNRIALPLANQQRLAVEIALEKKVLVITGGPGTGKTTLINAILKIFLQMKAAVFLAAPTGRAAKRMAEACGQEAKTIHRLLEYSPQNHGFQKDEDHPLSCDVLVVDEASMIDITLAYHLLKALPETATLILVGDVNQLPSVGPGCVLKDIIDSGRVPVAKLTEIFRQARQSRIVTNAHLVNRGRMPRIQQPGEKSDFFFIERKSAEKVVDTILELVDKRIPDTFGLDPVSHIQVLTPMNKGMVGSINLNIRLQALFLPGAKSFTIGGRTFKIGDKVMQLRNNYEKEVFNGDMGRIREMNEDTQEVVVLFDGRPVTYDKTEMDELALAYAVSVHKSQGSEFPAVVIPIVTQHYILLQRNLLYTAITRGRQLVVLVGEKKALAMAVANDRIRRRYTLLRQRIEASHFPTHP